MINADTLMLYLSHLGEGSWGAVRPHFLSVAADAGADADEGARALRYALEEIGFADFFAERDTAQGTGNGWRVCPTSLMASSFSGGASLCGSRDPRLLLSLEEAARAEGCMCEMRAVTVEAVRGLSFTLPRVSGTPGALAAVAGRLNVPLVASAPDAWLETFRSLREALPLAPKEELGLSRPGWEMRLCRPERRTWEPITRLTDAPLTVGAVLEWRREWLPRQRAVLTDRWGWVRLGDRESPYAGAMFSHCPLLRYDRASGDLYAPMAIPLPRSCARAAVMCAGALPSRQGGDRVYAEVPPRIAAVIGQKLGQPGLDDAKGNGATP